MRMRNLTKRGVISMRKLLTLVVLVLTFGLFSNTYAEGGTLVDADGDGFYCVLEDGENDGDAPIKFCNEDGQDRCDGIPNINLNDGHCSMDKNADGLFTLADLAIISSYNDLYFPYYPNYISEGVPRTFGGYGCFEYMKVVEYSRRLNVAGLKHLQLDLPFNVLPISSRVKPGCIVQYGVYHEYPAIN